MLTHYNQFNLINQIWIGQNESLNLIKMNYTCVVPTANKPFVLNLVLDRGLHHMMALAKEMKLNLKLNKLQCMNLI